MRTSIAGLSLVELMVALGIVGVLTMLAIPRYHAFMVKARRGEAKSNLSHIASLQSTYKIDYFAYYNADPLSVNGIGYKDGKGMEGQNDCDADKEVDKGTCNHLGFDPEGLSELRYLYQVRNGGSTVVASAASDDERKWIYPDCSGVHTNEECGYRSGDTVILAVNNRQSTVCRNITKYCPSDTSGFTPVVVPPPPAPPPPPPCAPTQCCDGTTPKSNPGLTCTGGWYGTYDATDTSTYGCCHTTPPLPPPSCAPTQCCDGTTPKGNPGLTCTGGWYGTYDATDTSTYGCCHTTPPPPPSCDHTIQCCDGSTPMTQPTTLACDSWHGTWSSTANDKGCCKCGTGKIFAFDDDNDLGTCCNDGNPVYTYHTGTSQGFCCPISTSYSHDTTTNTGRCCSSGHAWDGTNNVCVRACTAGCCDPSRVCCMPGNVRQKGSSDCSRGEYLTDHPECACKACDEEYACKEKEGRTHWTNGYSYTVSWDDPNDKCILTSNPPDKAEWAYPFGPHVCMGWAKELCSLTTECCISKYIKKTCPGNMYVSDHPECACKTCTEEYACKKKEGSWNSDGVSYTLSWDDPNNKCIVTSNPPDKAEWEFPWGSYNCLGRVRTLCLTTTECCIDRYTKKTCSGNEYMSDHPECACQACDEEYACRRAGLARRSNYRTRWDNNNNKCIVTSLHPSDQFVWSYTGGCHGTVVEECTACNRSSQCCVDDNHEVSSAEEANLTCDSWHGDWDTNANDKGCCICNAGKTFSYDSVSESGGCCHTGQSWDGTSCI